MKKVFIVDRDVLYKVWCRESYNISANSYEEACQKMIDQAELCKHDHTISMEDNKDIKFNESLPLYETYEELVPEDIHGDATIEILDDDYNPIWDNVNGKC